MGVLVGDGEDAGESALAPAWPLPEKTVVKPLLCGVGFRLFPALISARSSELSPVGDIMLNDLVLFICLKAFPFPVEEDERRGPAGGGGGGGGGQAASGSGGGGGGGGSSVPGLLSAGPPLCMVSAGSGELSSLCAILRGPGSSAALGPRCL